MDKLPKGIKKYIDPDSEEVFFSVEVRNKGALIAKEDEFTSLLDATTFYYKHSDKLNIKRREVTSGVRFEAEFYNGPKTKPSRKSFKTLKQAIEWRRQCRENINGVMSYDVERMGNNTFLDYSRFWIKTEVKPRRSLNTLRTYERILKNHVYPHIGKIKIKDIKLINIDLMVAAISEKGKSPGTINMVLAVIKRCLNNAAINDFIPKNILLQYEKIYKQKKEAIFWKANDVKRFFTYDKTWPYYALFLTAIRTGMRKGELLGLQWDCVNFESELFTIKRNRTQFETREATKSKQVRKIPIAADLLEVLREMKAKAEKYNNNFVFLTVKGQEIPYSRVGIIFRDYQIASRVTVKLSVHGLRHTFASHYIMNGGRLEELQKILGHSSIKMTEIYAHFTPKHLSASSEIFGRLEVV